MRTAIISSGPAARLRVIVAGLALFAARAAVAAGLQVPAEGGTIQLDPLVIGADISEESERYDPTGMGTMEADTYDEPFSNPIIWDELPDDDLDAEMAEEELSIGGRSQAELATSGIRLRLRGFPTPRLRDSYSQMGVPEVLNVRRSQVIQGALVPVTGRAAPGGIRNYISFRPRARPATSGRAEVNDQDDHGLRADTTGPIVPRRLWQRVGVDWQRRNGPQAFAWQEERDFTGAVTWRPTRRTSAMLEVDSERYRGDPAPGVPEYRVSHDTPILGPYRPLAYFHGYGPNAGVEKDVLAASLQVETQLTPDWILRTAVERMRRRVESDRFTRGVFELDTGTFGGTREPLHNEEPLDLTAAQVDLTGHFRAFGLEHKLLASVEGIRSRLDRRQRALMPEDRRRLLPDDVRHFDPFAPNFFRPAYSPETYKRVVTDRSEDTAYSGLALSDRTAIANGRLVVTAGARYDAVDLGLDDRKAGAAFPHVSDRAAEVTHHLGGNLVLWPGRLLLFANTSTAFEPSTRVDARTGRIQGNETTSGYELGFKGRLPRRLNYTLLFFDLTNENISRRNPRYNDPVLDPGLTEPELLAAGEERFRGGALDLRVQLSEALRVNARAGYTDAVSTRSPDLPAEVGRQLIRVPRVTAGLSTRYRCQSGAWDGLSLGVGAYYFGSFVARYADEDRAYLAYPGVTQVSARASYEWKNGGVEHEVELGIRNALDRDLLALLDQPGRGRSLTLEYSARF